MTRTLPLAFLLFFSTFALADSANLRVALSSGRDFDTAYAVVNNGPDVARNTVLTIDFPPTLPVDRFLGPESCDTKARPIRCEFGDRHVGLPATYGGISFIPPHTDATYVVTFTLTSDTPESDPSDNTASKTWSFKVEADMNVGLLPQLNARVDPGQQARYHWYVCNNIEGNATPKDVRVDLSVTGGLFELVEPPPGFTCSSSGATAVCTAAEGNIPCQSREILVRTSSDRKGGAAVVSLRVTSSLPERDTTNDSVSGSVAIYRWISVVNTADSGAGSLRDAIEQANGACSPGPCRIVFEIPPPVPAEGWYTIQPATELPAVTADRVTIEGSRQTALTGDTNPKGPEIAIDGRLAGSGLKVLTPCEGVVEGLALGNFDRDQGLWLASPAKETGHCGVGQYDRREVSLNHIGVDPSGTVPWPNLRGLRLDFGGGHITRNVISHNRYSGVWMWIGSAWFESNRIAGNGASGIFLGPQAVATVASNSIAGNAQMGVAIARGVFSVDIRWNAMKDNGGLGIDWELDGVSPSDDDDAKGPTNAPVLLAARYDPATNATIVDLTVKSAPLNQDQRNGRLDFYVNDGPDGDGERPVYWTYARADEIARVRFAGDHRGRWINATWTRVGSFDFGPWVTSELSNSLQLY